jgi:hypothetical protein
MPLGDLPDAYVDGDAVQVEQRRQLGDEDPGEEAVEDDLEDGVEGYEPGGVLGVSLGELVPDDDHGDAARQADHDEPDHVLGVVVQEDDRQEEHEERADDPVLHQRETEDLVVAEDLAELLVLHLGERRIHHHDEPDGDGDVGRPDVEPVDEAGHAGEGPTEEHADGHGKEDPGGEVAVEEREPLHGAFCHLLRLLLLVHRAVPSMVH